MDGEFANMDQCGAVWRLRANPLCDTRSLVTLANIAKRDVGLPSALLHIQVIEMQISDMVINYARLLRGERCGEGATKTEHSSEHVPRPAFGRQYTLLGSERSLPGFPTCAWEKYGSYLTSEPANRMANAG